MLRWLQSVTFVTQNTPKMKVFLLRSAIILLGIVIMMSDLAAQCPMCRLAAESNLQNGGTAARGLDAGILYLLAIPYLLVGTIGFIWWKNQKSK